jgi:plastocyanin
VIPAYYIRCVASASMFCCAPVILCAVAAGQLNTVRAHVEIRGKDSAKAEKHSATDSSNIVVWLKSLDGPVVTETPSSKARKRPQLIQRDKSFQPHLLVVPVGAAVDFPNRDPFFHNVFSLFDGKRFDLGLYESGTSNSVRFDRAGVSFLFCNIHPEMSAVVVAVDTPYYAVSDRSGNVAIADVPDGKYEMHVWYERSLPDELKSLSRTVTVSSTARDLGAIRVIENPSFSLAHKNKYGQDYAPPPAPEYLHR